MGGGRNGIPNCSECNESLSGKQYLIQGTDEICVACYESKFSNNCKTCQKKISPSEQDISYKDMHFCVTCFLCDVCGKSIANESFIYKDDTFSCGPCYEDRFAPKCMKCMKPFQTGSKRMEYDGESFCDSCFCCSTCDQAIGAKSFVKAEGQIICQACFESDLAKKCIKCNIIIKGSGVAYNDQNYCSSCFLCGSCDKELAGEEFVTHKEETFCLGCHERNFSKLCSKCAKAITGIGGSKMMVYEDMQWHFECFVCFTCSSPLEGQGFILHDDEVYCSACLE